MTVKIIKNSHVSVKPFRFDVDYSIVPYTRNCPFQHGIQYAELLEVTLCRAMIPINTSILDPDRVYYAKISGAQTWFSQTTGKTNVVITLDSPDLIARHAELLINNSDVASVYVPHITIIYDIPETDPDTRWWVNDILNKFNQGIEGRYYGNTIRFAGENVSDYVVDEADTKIPVVTKPI